MQQPREKSSRLRMFVGFLFTVSAARNLSTDFRPDYKTNPKRMHKSMRQLQYSICLSSVHRSCRQMAQMPLISQQIEGAELKSASLTEHKAK